MLQRKKILFVIPTLAGGGAERVTSHLINGINKQKFRLQLIISHRAEHTCLKDIHPDVEVIQLNLKFRVRYTVFPILRAIKKQKPDTVFLNMSHLNILIAIFIPLYKRYKWIARETNTLDKKVKSKFSRILYTIFYKNYNVIIAQCHDMKADLINNFKLPAEKIKVINNPINTNFIDLELKKKVEVSLPKNKINLVACGRLTYQKGFDNLVQAFAQLKYKDKYHLTILGQGNTKDPDNQEVLLRSLIETHNLKKCVSLVGFQNNIYAWLSQADFFILSSRYEGFPNVLLEALYCGTPALANDCPGGISEIINTANGLLFSFDQNSFEERLINITNMTFNHTLIAKDIQARYNLKRIIHKYESIL